MKWLRVFIAWTDHGLWNHIYTLPYSWLVPGFLIIEDNASSITSVAFVAYLSLAALHFTNGLTTTHQDIFGTCLQHASYTASTFQSHSWKEGQCTRGHLGLTERRNQAPSERLCLQEPKNEAISTWARSMVLKVGSKDETQERLKGR